MKEVTAPLHPDIDRGWAWVVVAAIFVYNSMVGGTIKTFGLFYVEFIHMFPEDGPAKVGLIGLLSGIASLVMAPLGGILGDKVQTRWIALGGGIVIAASFSCTAFAHHLAVAVLTFGCLAGGTLGLIDGPILSSIGCYFRRKRNMASGLSWTGSSAGGLVMAPFFTWLIQEYGIRGSVVLLGGIWLHVCVIGLLLRPLPKVAYLEGDIFHVQGQEEEIKKTSNGLVMVTDILGGSEKSLPHLSLSEKGVTHDDLKNINGEVPTTGEQRSDEDQTELLKQPLKDTINIPLHQKGLREDRNGTTRELLIQDLNSSNHEQQHTEKQLKLGVGALEEESLPLASHSSNPGYLCFLNNSRMWLVLIVLGCGFFGYYVPFVLIPLWAEELLISKSQVAWIISVIALVEILSRILLGIIIDSCGLRADWVLVVSYILVGTAGQIVYLVPSFWALIGYGCMHGMMGGSAHVVMATLVGQVVRMDRIGSAMGLVVMQLTLASAASTFVAGVVKEMTGSYGNVLLLSSGVYLVGAALYTLGPIMYRVAHNACQGRSR